MMDFTDASFFDARHSFAGLTSHELEIFRLHQHVSYPEFRKARLSFLKSLNAAEAAECTSCFVPKIAVFAGSFNPFHKGHYNVLQKAEHIFDKVIVAFGQNPEKNAKAATIPVTLKNRQIEHYDGLLTDFVSALGHDVVVIRGLRNSTDFQYEQNQYRYIQELMPDIKIVNIFCDKEFEHISSSGIRTLEKYGKHWNYILE